MSSKAIASKMMVEILYALAGKESPYIAKYSKTQVSRKLRTMCHEGYLVKKEEKYILTHQSAYIIQKAELWLIKITPPKKWDGKWRMVLFDIPIAKGKMRDTFRAHLKELGLVLYQHSVWVYPYPLEKTVHKISDFYRLSDHVLFAVADELNGKNKLMKKFNL